MENKFRNVPVEDDTTISFQVVASLGTIPVLYQKWCWECVTAESFIFDEADLGSLSAVEIEAEARQSPLVKEDSQITVTSRDGFIFVNFNFVT